MTNGWEFHYKRAELLLVDSYRPDLNDHERTIMVSRAQVHATLATLRTRPDAVDAKTTERGTW